MQQVAIPRQQYPQRVQQQQNTQQQAHMEKGLPCNIEAECGVLGSIIIDPDAILEVREFLQADDFYRDAHRTIYETVLRLQEQDGPADFITICDDLEAQGKLESVGGASYITSLINQVPTSGNAEYYGRIVERTSLSRQIIKADADSAASAYESNEPLEVLLKSIKRLQKIMERSVGSDDMTRASELLGTFQTTIDMVASQSLEITGLSTGFTALDTIFTGMKKQELIIIAARPGIGKSTLLLNIASHVAHPTKHINHATGETHTYKVVFFSLEMRKQELLLRLVCSLARIDATRVQIGDIYDDEWDDLVAAYDVIEGMELYFDDSATLNCMDIKTRVQKLEQQIGKVDLVVVDYIQLLKTHTKQSSGNRVNDVGEISRDLKTMIARELDVPVLCAAQLNRAIETRANKRPQLSDLRESGGIENDSDIVAFIHRDDAYDEESERKNIADIIVAKHRNGPKGDIDLYADEKHICFLPLTERKEIGQ